MVFYVQVYTNKSKLIYKIYGREHGIMYLILIEIASVVISHWNLHFVRCWRKSSSNFQFNLEFTTIFWLENFHIPKFFHFPVFGKHFRIDPTANLLVCKPKHCDGWNKNRGKATQETLMLITLFSHNGEPSTLIFRQFKYIQINFYKFLFSVLVICWNKMKTRKSWGVHRGEKMQKKFG